MKTRFWNKNYILAVTLSAVVYIASNMLITTLPKYAVGQGQSKFTVGALMLVYTLSACVTRLMWGYFADRYGRLLVVYIGIGLNICSVILLLLNSDITMLFISRAFFGAGFSAVITASATLSTEVVEEKYTAKAIAIYGLGGVLTQAVAPPFALYLFNYGLTIVAYCVIALLVISAILAKFIKVNKRKGNILDSDKTIKDKPKNYDIDYAIKEQVINKDKEDYSKEDLYKPIDKTCVAKDKANFNKSAIFEKSAVPASFVAGIITFSTAGIFSFVPLLTGENGIESVSGFFVANSIGLLFSRLVFVKINERVAHDKLFYLGIIIFTTGFLLLAFAGNNISLIIAGFLYGYGLGSVHPILNTQAVASVKKQNRAGAMAVFYAFQDMGVAAGSLLCGFLADIFTLKIVFLTCAGFAAFSVIPYFFTKKHRAKRQQ